ncbi:mitochondrial carrier domain-containing protein [Cantharellus anzutake]|uniref:mitochondrial carrier domain-containing protein n=1 Tax=Cantharellus anzutake TaxID=1750568 RepID=UPI001908E43C|nr:mitochondrial carrier domain-containing protein [Cantharellus anzutake]KAF8344071.1 mitochondrial carrier domain-containing protein [Cantharellus anzutake]
MPFEVAKILMQVQWIPRDAVAFVPEEVIYGEDAENGEQDAMSDTSSESYFHDPAREAFSSSARLVPETPTPAPTDDEGYLLRQSINDDGTRPDYVIPVGPTDGVWAMVKRIRAWKSEGLKGLWKAQLTSTLIDAMTPTIQTGIQELLLSTFVSSQSIPIYPLPAFQTPGSHLTIAVASHALTGFILSPLDLVRTRLIVQSSHPSHRTYSGPIDAFKRITKNEGGFYALYMHPNLLIPTILDTTIRPLLSLAAPLVIHRFFGIAEDTHPTTYAVLHLLFSSASLLITLPIETVRRRLQVQSRNSARPLRACVETRPTPYVGVVDAWWRILSEERSTVTYAGLRQRKRRQSFKGKEKAADVSSFDKDDEDLLAQEESRFGASGLAQLYRGFTMGLSANAVFFLMSSVGIETDPSSGWTEL